MTKILFLIKTAISFSLGLHEGRPGYRRSLHPSKANTSKHEIFLTFFYFCGSYLTFWIWIQPTKTIGDPCGSQHWSKAVLRIRIRDPVHFDPWIRDPGWVKNKDPDYPFFWVKILKFFDADPRWKKFVSGIRGWRKLVSGINIPDPQHWSKGTLFQSRIPVVLTQVPL